MKKTLAMTLAVILMTVGLVMLGTTAVAQPKNIWYCGPEDGDRVVNVHDRQLQVVVQENANCLVKNSTVKTVRAVNTAHDVKVWNTKVVRGVHVLGATGTVHIGVRHCNFDPPVGNNVKVTKSHNVLICYVTAKNNIEVTKNDGRITLRNNRAYNNIKVTRTKKFVRDAGIKHRWAGRIRMYENWADNHIHYFKNKRGYSFRNNVPEIWP